MIEDALTAAESHANQFFSLLQSMSANGFSPKPNTEDPMRVTMLHHRGVQCWQVSSGSHRLVSAAVLGLESITAEVTRTVELEAADTWPNVASGVFSLEEATTVFRNAVEVREVEIYAELSRQLFSPKL